MRKCILFGIVIGHGKGKSRRGGIADSFKQGHAACRIAPEPIENNVEHNHRRLGHIHTVDYPCQARAAGFLANVDNTDHLARVGCRTRMQGLIIDINQRKVRQRLGYGIEKGDTQCYSCKTGCKKQREQRNEQMLG